MEFLDQRLNLGPRHTGSLESFTHWTTGGSPHLFLSFFFFFFWWWTYIYLFIFWSLTSFFFFYFIYFNWRLITLHYCSVFCHTLTWISHGCTCLPYPEFLSHLPPHPIPLGHPSAPGHPERPVSCIQPGLAICFTYGNIHVSMLFSQIIPPSPSPTESKSLFFTSVFLLLSHI